MEGVYIKVSIFFPETEERFSQSSRVYPVDRGQHPPTVLVALLNDGDNAIRGFSQSERGKSESYSSGPGLSF